MGRKARSYSKVDEAQEMIVKLCKKYPDVFWSVQPDQVLVMGIDNVERSEKAVEKDPLWTKLSNIKGVNRAVYAEHGIGVRYIVELFWADWNNWKETVKLAVLAKNLLEITPDVDKKNRPDCVGFKILYKALGINWERDDGHGIPHLLQVDVEFDLDLRPGLDDTDEDDEIAEVVKEIKAENNQKDDADEEDDEEGDEEEDESKF